MKREACDEFGAMKREVNNLRVELQEERKAYAAEVQHQGDQKEELRVLRRQLDVTKKAEMAYGMQANMSMWERIGFQSLCSVGGRPARVDFSPSSDVALEGASSSRPDSRAPVVDVPPAVALAGTSRRSKDSTTEPHITLEGASSSRPDSRAPVLDVPPAV